MVHHGCRLAAGFLQRALHVGVRIAGAVGRALRLLFHAAHRCCDVGIHRFDVACRIAGALRLGTQIVGCRFDLGQSLCDLCCRLVDARADDLVQLLR